MLSSKQISAKNVKILVVPLSFSLGARDTTAFSCPLLYLGHCCSRPFAPLLSMLVAPRSFSFLMSWRAYTVAAVFELVRQEEKDSALDFSVEV